MGKKILSLLCTLSILLTMVVLLPGKAEAATPTFYAGYSRVDINPYVVDGDFNSGIMELPLRGVGDVWDRLSSKLVDDNGDGKVDREDGLKVTCIAVSDQNGNTVLMITIDLIGGDMIDKVRDEICTRVEAALASGELKNVKLTREQIHYAGTHTHNAPDTTVYNKNGKTGTNKAGKDLNTINTNLGIWIDRTIEDVGDAAILALKDRAEATITKDAIDAAADTKSPVKGKVMNSVRHYVNEAAGCVAGDNFNTRGNNPKQVTEVNDTLYLLKFAFEDSSKLPIVLANWRGHPSLNNSDTYSNSGRTCLSSDFVNAFRHALEYDCTVNSNCTGVYKTTQSCRAAFFQGAGGNVNPRGQEKLSDGSWAYGWIDNYAKNFKDSRGNGYGRVLAAMAQHALSSSARRETVRPSEIRANQQYYNTIRRDTGITAVGYEAALSFQALYAENPDTKLPYVYENEEGEIYVIGSRFHANNVVSYWSNVYQKASDSMVDMELCTFLIGENLAFVTIPGEPFDYYYKQEGIFTPENNLWNDLNTSTYGTPFVLGYCNGARGYIPNSYAYDYNLGSEKWMRGSYESNITPYPRGTGEKMIGILGDMLDALENGQHKGRDAYCEHCQQTVTWQAHNGASKLYTGHYYLLADTMGPQIQIPAGETVCFDLNGHYYRGDTRAMYTSANGGSTVNIMDTSKGKTGMLQGCGGTVGAASGYGGAAIIIDKGNTLNVYSGTIAPYERSLRSVVTAGTLRNSGTVNLYGGTIAGGVASSFTGQYISSNKPATQNRTAIGGTIYNSGTLNVYGGKIENGSVNLITGTVWENQYGTYSYSQTVTPTDDKTTGIYQSSSGKLNLSGNAVVDSLYLSDTSSKYLFIDTSEKSFSGSLGVTLNSMLPTSGIFGKCTENADLSGGTFTFTNGLLQVASSGTNLVATAGALLRNLDGNTFHYYDSVQSAQKDYTWSETNPLYIRVMADSDADLQVTKDMYLDLYGHNISGDITVSQDKTLYCMDYQTEDYTVADGVYGKLTGTITGNVEGVPEMTVGKKPSSSYSYRLPYLKITEEDGVSFHALRLHLRYVSLRPSEAGIYYSAYINGDEKIQEHVDSFGVILNANEPVMTDGALSQHNLYTTATQDQWKSQSYYYSVLLSGIMKQENTAQVNAANAGKYVYACPYIVFDGQTLCGFEEAWTLQQLVETADEGNKFNNDTLTAALELYRLYESVMENWNIPRLKIANTQTQQ